MVFIVTTKRFIYPTCFAYAPKACVINSSQSREVLTRHIQCLASAYCNSYGDCTAVEWCLDWGRALTAHYHFSKANDSPAYPSRLKIFLHSCSCAPHTLSSCVYAFLPMPDSGNRRCQHVEILPLNYTTLGKIKCDIQKPDWVLICL